MAPAAGGAAVTPAGRRPGSIYLSPPGPSVILRRLGLAGLRWRVGPRRVRRLATSCPHPRAHGLLMDGAAWPGAEQPRGRFRQARPEHVRRVRALLCPLAEPARARNATRAEHKEERNLHPLLRGQQATPPSPAARAPSMPLPPRTTLLLAGFIIRHSDQRSSHLQNQKATHMNRKKKVGGNLQKHCIKQTSSISELS